MKHLLGYNQLNESSSSFYSIVNNDLEKFISKFYYDNYHEELSFDDAVERNIDIYRYIDEDRFMEDFINGEIDSYQSDLSSLFMDDDDDDKEFLSKYLIKNGDNGYDIDAISEYNKLNKVKVTKVDGDDQMFGLLMKLPVESLVSLVDKYGEPVDVCDEYIRNKYRHNSPADIISMLSDSNDCMDVDTLESQKVESYVNMRKINDDQSEPDLDEILNTIDVKWNEGFQKELVKYISDGELLIEFVDLDILIKEVGDDVDFQMKYFGAVSGKNSNEGVGEPEDNYITVPDVMKLIGRGVTITGATREKFAGVDIVVVMVDMGLFNDSGY